MNEEQTNHHEQVVNERATPEPERFHVPFESFEALGPCKEGVENVPCLEHWHFPVEVVGGVEHCGFCGAIVGNIDHLYKLWERTK